MATNSKVRERLIASLGDECAQQIMRKFGGTVLRIPVPGPSQKQIQADLKAGRTQRLIAVIRGIDKSTVNRAGKRA